MAESQGNGRTGRWHKLAVCSTASTEQVSLRPCSQLEMLAWLGVSTGLRQAAQSQLPLPQQVGHLGAFGAHEVAGLCQLLTCRLQACNEERQEFASHDLKVHADIWAAQCQRQTGPCP